MNVSGKITKKNVKSGPYGDKVSFLVGGNWLSCFAGDKKMSPDVKTLIRELAEGDNADFEVVEAPNKNDPSKPYLNITGVVRVTQLREDVTPPSDRMDDGQQDAPKAHTESGDNKARSMSLSYAKDKHVASGDWDNESIIATAKRFEHYILTGE